MYDDPIEMSAFQTYHLCVNEKLLGSTLGQAKKEDILIEFTC